MPGRAWRERGHDDHERKERDERFAGQRDASIDELDLEHAVHTRPSSVRSALWRMTIARSRAPAPR